MTRIAFRLHRRIGLVIAAVVLVNSTVFAIVALGIAYAVEDRQFVQALGEEIDRQQAQWARTGSLADPARDYISIYRRPDDLPSDLIDQVQAEREQIEFRGLEGRHYHVARFSLSDGGPATPAIAVAEVSRYLFIRPALESILLFMALLGWGTALITGLLGFFLARRALAPLGALAVQVGDSEGPVPRIDASRYPTNEIGWLAARLASAFERICGFIARERDFTRAASHELRTPIAVIRGSAEVVALDPGLSDANTRALRRIDAATRDMVATLDLLLGLAREEQVHHRERLLLRPIVEQAVEDARARFPEASLTTQILIEAGTTIETRRTLLQLILNNLVTNSFAHARARRLVISLSDGELRIADDGVGMAVAARRPRTEGASGNSPGTGLGLQIVQRLCEAGGAAFAVSDLHPGTETRITFRPVPRT